ncbi:MAG: Hint domain-containing protein [Paracoccus sp. (in: a-proteobacteria)]|nr:Hint domain-containing protein [Paracoccus sp. (in: a-proteobacteria)]
MPSYTIDIIGVTGTSFGTFTSLGVVGKITYFDDDTLGVGDNNPMNETGSLPVITGITGTLPAGWVGQTLSYGWQQSINGTGLPDALGMVIGGGTNFISTHLVQYPGGTPIVTGTTYTASNITDVPNEIIVCFCRGTLITTDQGVIAIEDLGVGDMVITMDNGPRPIRWIGKRKLTPLSLARNPKLRPVRIRAGALGENMPEVDLTVSPQHRILIRSAIAQRMFDTREVLLPAIKLCALDGIDQVDDATEVEYWHMLFDGHEIVYSNGAATESLFTGPEALKGVSLESRAEIIALFPEIIELGYVAKPVRPIPGKGKTIKTLVARHAKNCQMLVAH